MQHSYWKLACLPSVVLASTVLLSTVRGENWPHWRGPAYSGVSTEKNLPAEWNDSKNVAWKLSLPGRAGATPAIWDRHIFVPSTTAAGDLMLVAVSTEGKKLWERKVGSGNRRGRGDEGSMASPSPVTDGKHVWVVLGTGEVACFDFDGNQVWKFNLQDRFGRFRLQFGFHSSPVLWKDRVLLQLIHGDGRASTQEAIVVALDKSNGKTLWKKDRVTGAYRENEHSYASPMLCDTGKSQLFITHGADYTIAYDPQTGEEVWRMGGLNPQNDPNRRYHPTLRFVASPGISKDLIVLPTAKNQQIFAIRPNLKGDLTNNKKALVWKLPRYTPDVPSPLIHNGLVYLCEKDGTLRCLDARDGTILYTRRLHFARYRASPAYADGKIYLCARDGVVTVVQTGKEFKKLAENKMGDDIEASPAFSNGTLYIRTFGALWAIRKE